MLVKSKVFNIAKNFTFALNHFYTFGGKYEKKHD